MVFYVGMVTFPMTLFMNEFSSSAIPTYFAFIMSKTLQHGTCENVTWHANMSRMPFIRIIQGRPAWNDIWMQLLPTTSRCMYKMLVACASDNEGKESFYIMNVMFFIVTSNTVDSNQNITSMIKKIGLFPTLWTSTIGAHTNLVSKHKTRNRVSLEKKWQHVNMTFSRLQCSTCFAGYWCAVACLLLPTHSSMSINDTSLIYSHPNILWWKIVTDNWDLEERSLNKW